MNKTVNDSQFSPAVGASRLLAGMSMGCCRLLLFVGLSVWMTSAAATGMSLERWRSEVFATRMLAENDARQAYQQTQRLQADLKDDAPASDKGRVFNLLARTEIYLGLTEQAAEHIKMAQNIVIPVNDKIGQVEALLNIALNSINQGNLNALIESTTSSVELLDGIDRPDLLGEAMLRVAMMYHRLGQLDVSLSLTMQAMEIAERAHNPLVSAYAHQGLAISLEHGYRHVEAREHYQYMREQAVLAHSKLLEAFAMTGLSNCLSHLGDTEAAEKMMRDSLTLYREVGAQFGLSFGLFGLADQLYRQGHYQETLPVYEEILAIYRTYPNKIGLWYALNARSNTYLALNQSSRALSDAEQAYALAKTMGFPAYQSDSARRLSSAVASQGNLKRAYELSLEAGEMADKASREKANNNMVALIKHYQTESKQREIDELSRRNQQQKIELLEREFQQQVLWMGLTAIAVLLLVMAYFLFRLRHSNQLLATLNTRLQQSSEALEHQTELLESILESMADAVLVVDTAGKILVANPVAQKLVGIDKSVDGRSWCQRYRLLMPDRVTPYPLDELPLAKAIRGISSDNVEIFGVDPLLNEDRWLRVTARPLRDSHHQVRGGVAVLVDIGEAKLLEDTIRQSNIELERRLQANSAQLQQQRLYLHALMEALTMPVWIKDTQSRYLLVNQAHARANGRRIEEMIGKTDAELGLAAAMQLLADEQEAMSTAKRKVKNRLLPHIDGNRCMEISYTPLLSEAGVVLACVVIAQVSESQNLCA